jgi:hypothetical protein
MRERLPRLRHLLIVAIAPEPSVSPFLRFSVPPWLPAQPAGRLSLN